MDTEGTQAFGPVLKRYRVASGLTHEQLAERAGLSVRGISDLERGIRTQPRAYTVHHLADALSLSADDRAIFEAAARTGTVEATGEDLSPGASILGRPPIGALVAREEERDRLQSALDAVVEGTGRVVLLGGELGIGKTRLIPEVVADARTRGCALMGAGCSPRGAHSTLAPFLAALGGLAAHPPDGLRTETQRSWKHITRMVANLPLDGAGRTLGALEEHELYRAITDLLALISRSVPVVLILDDLQWADDQSLLLLVHLARAAPSVAMLIVGAFRDVRVPEEYPDLARTLQILSKERLADRITMRRLSLDETTRLAGGLMGDQRVSEEFADFVYRRTKGVPRLIEQLLRSLGGRLELEGEIGAGAMGRVFRAHDRERGEEVAAKLVLARSEIDLDTLLRFQQEGAVLARLEHPHIVDIHDTFAEEHASCIIMELLDGESLGQILRGGPLPLSRAKGLALQVADALAYAHSQEIVHRDIKPDNVMVLEGDRVKVTDFGIARLLRPDTSLQTLATTGMRLGTPLYMAPEQIEGKTIDGRTDIYALGAMLYHMVTGRPPFEGNDALTVAVRHLQEDPVPPSQANPAIPAGWDTLILKAMARDPSRRFQSATEMQEAIAALNEPAAPQVAFARRPWRLTAAVGLITLFAAVFGALWVHAARNQQPSPSVAGIDAYLTQHHFSGAIFLERDGRVLLSKGYGLADRKSGRPNTIRSAWLDAGVYRFITAIAILRLQDQHRLSVHDRLCQYVAGCPRAWRPITIQQLLLDTSGLGGFVGTFATTTASGGTNQSIARCRVLPVGVPGAIAPRSACNVLLLNAIVARVAGMPWAAAMRELVFDPAHMVDSGQLTNVAVPTDWVQGYSTGSAVRMGNLDADYLPYSSIQDLGRMDQTLLSGHLLSPSAMRALFTPYIRGGAILNRYFEADGSKATRLAGGYQTFLRAATGSTVTVADEPGLTAGISLDNAISPQNDTIAIIATNGESGPAPTDVIFGLASHLLWGRQHAAEPPPSPQSRHISSYLARAQFHGYVYLERRGHVILNRGFGLADAEAKVPNTAQTKWPAFAATRFFVALAIMKLHDEGRVSVHDRVCSYVSGCPTSWHPITIRELLNNTSGIGSYDPFTPGTTLRGTMAACKAMPLVLPPGTEQPNTWSDCNTFLLDNVVEKVTGKAWEAAMQQLVYGPAGMTDTGRMTNALQPPRRGQLYRTGVPTPNLNYDGYYLPFTTVEDLIRLDHALLAGKLISHRSLDAMFAPEMPDDPSAPGGSPWRGYDVIISPATSTTYKVVCAVCVNGGGEDDTGAHAGFFITDSVSPGAGTIQIEVNNDTGYFNPGDDDNAFGGIVSQLLYGK